MAQQVIDSASHLAWISGEIEQHRAAIKALEALRDCPSVLDAAMTRAADVAQAVSRDDNSGMQLALPVDLPRSVLHFALEIAKLIPTDQKVRIGPLTEQLVKAGVAVSRADVHRTLKRFPDRFREHDRGWWSILKGGAQGAP